MSVLGKPMMSIFLRGLSCLCFLTSAIVIFSSSQRIHHDPHIKINTINYSQWMGFRFLLIVQCIAFLYNLIVILLPPGSQLWKTVIVLDVIVILVVVSSLGAGWQTFELLSEGNIPFAGWWPMCRVSRFFCGMTLAALIASSLGFSFEVALLIWTLHVCADPFLLGE